MTLTKREEVIELYDKYNMFLTQTQKQSIHLYLIEDLSLGEIAKIVVTSRQAIHDSIKKGIKKLENVSEKIDI